MRIIGIDTNSHFLAVSLIDGGRFDGSRLLPFDGPARREEHQSRRKHKVFEQRSALERLDVMGDLLDELLAGTPVDFAYIEEPPFVNSVKTFAELTSVVMVCRSILLRRGVSVSLANVSTWKKRTIGNARADKTEIRQWALAHIPGITPDLTEDEMDAAVIAFGAAVAAGDVKRA